MICVLLMSTRKLPGKFRYLHQLVMNIIFESYRFETSYLISRNNLEAKDPSWMVFDGTKEVIN